MKRSLLAGLLVFLLVQSKAMVAEVPDRANQLTELIQRLRGRMIPTVALTLVNKANVPAKTVTAAKTEVEKIYRQAGVQVVWTSNEQRDQSNTIQLTVVIVRNCVNKQTCQAPSAAGMALGSDGQGTRWAYVFYNRIRESAEKSIHANLLNRPSESQILGLAIAHEAGHLLLPLGHAPSGLMRSKIDIASLSEATTDLQFTPEQAMSIRKLLMPAVRNPTFAMLRIPKDDRTKDLPEAEWR